MGELLHILTKPDDLFAAELIAQQRAAEAQRVRVVDLTGTEPDYCALLEWIFTADSIQVW